MAEQTADTPMTDEMLARRREEDALRQSLDEPLGINPSEEDLGFSRQKLNDRTRKTRIDELQKPKESFEDGPLPGFKPKPDFDPEMAARELEAQEADKAGAYGQAADEDRLFNEQFPRSGRHPKTPDGLSDRMFRKEQETIDNRTLRHTEFQPMFPQLVALYSPVTGDDT